MDAEKGRAGGKARNGGTEGRHFRLPILALLRPPRRATAGLRCAPTRRGKKQDGGRVRELGNRPEGLQRRNREISDWGLNGERQPGVVPAPTGRARRDYAVASGTVCTASPLDCARGDTP